MTKDTSLEALKGREQWRPEDAELVLEEWKKSGLSMTKFGQQHGIDERRIAWWKKRLTSSSSDNAPAKIVPLRVRGTTSTTLGVAVSLVVEERVRIEIVDPDRVPAAWLASVVDVMSKGSS